MKTEPREVNQVQAVVNGAKSAAEPGPGLTFRPEIWIAYPCPGGCGKTMQAHRGAVKVHGDPAARIAQGRPDRLDFCEDCAPAPPRPTRPTLDRSEALAAAGCPPKYRDPRKPFIEPAVWPSDPRRPDFDLSTWAGDPWCVVFRGDVESGKTYLATELLWRLMSFGMQAIWTRASRFVTAVYAAPREEKAATWERYASAPALLVDEIGRGHDGGAWDVISELVGLRHELQVPTIFTTNRQLGPADRDASGRPKLGQKLGLADEDAGTYRRLKEGIAVGMFGRWAPPAQGGAA